MNQFLQTFANVSYDIVEGVLIDKGDIFAKSFRHIVQTGTCSGLVRV